MRFLDTMTNLVAKLGTEDKSKLANDRFSNRHIHQRELLAMYRSDWLGRKIIDAPVFDMLREWRNWQAENVDIEAMESAEDHHGVVFKLSLALRMARLFGGSAIIIGADVANPSMPLRPNAIGKNGLKYLTVVSRYDIVTPEIDRDPASPTFGQPPYYMLKSTVGGGVQLHPSRVLRFIGADRLDIDFNIDGWGDSVLLAIYDAIHHSALTQTAVAELIHEAKVDVIGIPNLGTTLSSQAGTDAIAKRFTAAAALKSINNMLLLDETETWERKQTSFVGMKDILDTYLQIVSGASDIPATRLIGTTPKGMSATGESDLRNYYDMLVGVRRQVLAPQLAYLDQILWLDAIGSIPKGVYPVWNPMWQLSPTEKAAIGYQKAQATNLYSQTGLIDETALAKGTISMLIEDGFYPELEAAIEELQSGLNGEEPGIGPGRQATAQPPQNDNPKATDAVRLFPTRLASRR